MPADAIHWVLLSPPLAWTDGEAGQFESALARFGPTAVQRSAEERDEGLQVELAFATAGSAADFLGDGNRTDLFRLLLKDGPLGDRSLLIRHSNQSSHLGVEYRGRYRNEADLATFFGLARSLDEEIRAARRDLRFPLDVQDPVAIDATLEPSPEGLRWRLSVRRDLTPPQRRAAVRNLQVVANADPTPRLNDLPWELV